MPRRPRFLLLLAVAAVSLVDPAAGAAELRGAGVDVGVGGGVAALTVAAGGDGDGVFAVREDDHVGAVGGDWTEEGGSGSGVETSSVVDETTMAALLAAFGGGDEAAKAKEAAGGIAARVTSPIPFKLMNCDPTAAIQVAAASVTDPIPIGTEMTVSAAGSVAREVVAPIQTTVKLEKEFYGKWLPVPCLTVLGRKVGSCDYDDVCQEFEPRVTCPPPLGPAGVPCACPIPAGDYSLPPATVSTAVPKELPKELGDGNYRVAVSMKDPVGPVACYNVEFSTVGM